MYLGSVSKSVSAHHTYVVLIAYEVCYSDTLSLQIQPFLAHIGFWILLHPNIQQKLFRWVNF